MYVHMYEYICAYVCTLACIYVCLHACTCIYVCMYERNIRKGVYNVSQTYLVFCLFVLFYGEDSIV